MGSFPLYHVNVLFATASCTRPGYENINDPKHTQQAFACHESKVLLKWHSKPARVFASPKNEMDSAKSPMEPHTANHHLPGRGFAISLSALTTGKRHAYNIDTKLEVRKRTQAVSRARQLGLIL